MAARHLLSRIKTTNNLLSLPNLPPLSLFSTLCRKSKHFHITPPPVPKKVPFVVTAHGVTWEDPYRWMSDINDPDFISYLNQENSYAEAFMRDTEEMQRILYSEMISRIPSKITTPPEHWGPWLYYECIPEGKEYPVLCRKPAAKRNGFVNTLFNSLKEDEVLLDWNEIAEHYGYVHVGACRISPDHNFLAYTLDTTGNEHFLLQVKDLRNKSILSQPAVKGVVSLAWAQDSCTLFYTLCDQQQRPYRVLCTKLGSHSGNDEIVFTENDSRFCLDITSTKDGKFVTVNSNSRTSSEVYVINATNPQDGLQRFCKRVSGVQYFLEHHGSFFYVLTNAPMRADKKIPDSGYYLARCEEKDAQSVNLKIVIVPGEDTYFEDMDIFNGHLVLFVNRKGSPSICSVNMPIDFDCKKEMDMNDLDPWFFPLPSNMCMITPGSNHDFGNSVFRAVLSSPVMPDLLIDYDMSRKTFSIVQQEDVRNISTGSPNNGSGEWKDFSEKYTCVEKEVISHDGIRIPLTILFSRSAYQKGQSPGLLHGYGAYGESLDKSWSPDRLSLLDRGWMFAFADVRGGAGNDPCWHRSGCGLNKLNSIHDFVSCGEYLINEGLIHKNKLSAFGISAGCVLVGASINMRPELFCAAILKVPFLDVVNTLLEPSLALTSLDYEEFGNPRTKSYLEYIGKYSPYDNIPRGICCPSMLVSASFNDSRVGIWEAAKWVAKMRDSTSCSTCSSQVILKADLNGGHFQQGGHFAHCQQTSYEYAYLIKATRPT